MNISTNKLQSSEFGAFLSRLTLGVILLAHGVLKITVFTIPGTVAYFDSIGIPASIAYLTIGGEVLGGAALILGAFPRLVALLSLPILAGATWAHAANGWVFSNQGGGWEFPLLLLVLAVIVLVQGAGSFALKGIPAIERLLPNALKS